MSLAAHRLRRNPESRHEIVEALNELDALAENAALAAVSPSAAEFEIRAWTGDEIAIATILPAPVRSGQPES